MDYEQSLFFLIVRREWSEKVRSRENKQNSCGLEGTFDYKYWCHFLITGMWESLVRVVGRIAFEGVNFQHDYTVIYVLLLKFFSNWSLVLSWSNSHLKYTQTSNSLVFLLLFANRAWISYYSACDVTDNFTISSRKAHNKSLPWLVVADWTLLFYC